ncbi:hypothetical protein HY251_00175 [bacterium]|nr:hypothetical protein [bacterium]
MLGDGLRVRALDLADGGPLWDLDLSSLKAGVSLAAGVHKLAVAPSRLVGLTKDGVVFVLAGEPSS